MRRVVAALVKKVSSLSIHIKAMLMVVAKDVNMEEGELEIIQEGKAHDSVPFETHGVDLEDNGETKEDAEDVDMEKGDHELVQEGKEHNPDLFEYAEMGLEHKRPDTPPANELVQEGKEQDPDLFEHAEMGLEHKRPDTPPAQGSSRTTGGVLRGRAMGNVFNFPDAPDILEDTPVPAKGTLRLYSDLAHQPSIHKPILTMKTDAKPTLGPILQKLARSYSPVRSMCLYMPYLPF